MFAREREREREREISLAFESFQIPFRPRLLSHSLPTRQFFLGVILYFLLLADEKLRWYWTEKERGMERRKNSVPFYGRCPPVAEAAQYNS